MNALHAVIAVLLASILVILIRRKLLHVDLSFPWFIAIVALAFVGSNEALVTQIADALDIAYAPMAIVFLTFLFVLSLIVTALIGLTRLRHRQLKTIRHVAAMELDLQERG